MTNTFERHENKVLVDISLLPLIDKYLENRLVVDEYNIGGKPYEICNIYFDNERCDVIRRSVEKPFFKEKLRLRSYGTPTKDDNVFFEIKRKMDHVGTKRRAILPLRDIYGFLDTHSIPDCYDYINRQVLAEIAYFIETNDVVPCVYVGYLRKAFYAKDDPSFRLTFDSDILTRRTDVCLESGRYGTPLLPNGKILMEVKFTGAVPLWLAHMFSELGISFSSFSKIGNEFKQTLLSEFSSKSVANTERKVHK